VWKKNITVESLNPQRVDLEGGYVGGLDNQESSNGGEVVDVLEV
jgi:hypothetical protein